MAGRARRVVLAVVAVSMVGWLYSTAIEASGPGVTSRVSVSGAGAQGNLDSCCPAVSGEGRFIAFASNAINLVPGDTNGKRDVFVRDRQTGSTERASVDSVGQQGNGDSYAPAISADGRFVAFASEANNLVQGDTNRQKDIFVRDRETGVTERMSVDSAGHQSNGWSDVPAISADGRFVAFTSAAINLVAGDSNFVTDIFVHDRQTGLTERVSVDGSGVQGNGSSDVPAISGDGRFVAFTSYARNLVAGDNNGQPDAFVRDRQTGATQLASLSSASVQANSSSYDVGISADGRFVAFASGASNLVEGDANRQSDVFVRDRLAGLTERVSVGSAGTESNGWSDHPKLSVDGRYVVFDSLATNLVASDTNGVSDVFTRDRATGSTMRASVDSASAQGNAASNYPAISADGRVVSFASLASNLVPGDTNGKRDVFAQDPRSTMPLVNAGPPGTIDEGGTFVSTGYFTDPDQDTWTATVDYGDGSGAQPLALTADKTFGLSHRYVDDGVYTVTVRVSDPEGTGSGATRATVSNVAPTVGPVTVAYRVVPVGTAISAAAQLTDAGTADTHVAFVDLGRWQRRGGRRIGIGGLRGGFRQSCLQQPRTLRRPTDGSG